MAVINLNNCFPKGADGKSSPLPKQSEFMQAVLDPNGPKYILYCGGIGSGKTIVGCVTMLALAIQYPGDYLICRQYTPELKITTLKTFLEITPPELIDEYRVADGIVRIKAAGGKVSNIIFRQLDEFDKLRSLNLSAFLIDESSQVSEEAFMLLQGRLRGPGLRKGFLTTNPNGHDWQYSWFVKQDLFNNEAAKKQFRIIKAPSTENTHLPDGYVQSMMSMWSPERIKREIEGSFDAFEGMVYNEFRRDVHVIQPFVVPKEWTRVVGIDAGYRNAAAWIWGAVDYDENIYIYREFYENEWLIEEICKGNKKLNKAGVLQMMKGEKISNAVIDPSVRAVRGQAGNSDWDVYRDNLPPDFPLGFANNDVKAGIGRVKSYLKINPKNNKPRLFIFNTCLNLIDELSKYRYKELKQNQHGVVNEREEPIKVNDHACFSAGTLIRTLGGLKSIESITEKDHVLTRKGFMPVEFSGSVGSRHVELVTLSSGDSFKVTPDHPIFTTQGKVQVRDLTPYDTCVNLGIWKKLLLTESYLGKLGIIIGQMVHTVNVVSRPYTEKFLNFIMEMSQMGSIFTTKTEIQTITISPTLNAYSDQPISPNMVHYGIPGQTLRQGRHIWNSFDLSLSSGTDLRPVGNGIRTMPLRLLKKPSKVGLSLRSVISVIKTLILSRLPQLDLSTAIRIVSRVPLGVEEVFNLTVQNQHEYYVGDILVANCDALRYLIMTLPEPPNVKDEVWNRVKRNSLEGSIVADLKEKKNPSNHKDLWGD